MIRYPDLFSWLKDREGGYVLNWDANDLLKLLDTWYYGDISIIKDDGDYVKALRSIKAKGLIMPSKTDLYFPVRTCPYNVAVKRELLTKFQRSRKTVLSRSRILPMESYP